MLSHLFLKISLFFYIWNVVVAEELNESILQKSTGLQNNNRQKSNTIHGFYNEYLILWSLFSFFRNIFSVHNCEFPKWVTWNG